MPGIRACPVSTGVTVPVVRYGNVTTDVDRDTPPAAAAEGRLAVMASRATRASVMLTAVAVGVVVILWTMLGARPEPVTRSEHRIAVADGRLTLDATLFVPAGVTADVPAPAVLMAHGFGGSKRSVTSDALTVARNGYVVLAWSARGFGTSEGRIALNSTDAEIADVSSLIDWLAERPDVRRDRAGDPRVGMTGASYGGGASLLAAAADDRIDAIVPVVAWHSLVESLAPNAAGDTPGVFKQQWASLLFTAGASPRELAAARRSPPAPARPQSDRSVLCGRFTREICDAYSASAEAGALTSEAVVLLRRADLDGALDRIAAPTLLVQAQSDTLFPLDQSVANARGIARAGTAVKLVWIPGGHAVGASDGNIERVRALTLNWFDRWLRDDESVDTGPVFEWTDRASGATRSGTALAEPAGSRTLTLSADGRLVDGAAPREDGPDDGVVAWAGPPGGEPAALSSLPGLGAVADALPPTDVPGQHVTFETSALERDLQVLGEPRLRVPIDATTTDVVVFAKLYDVAPGGLVTLPQQAVAPARMRSTPATVTLELPTLAHRFRAGHRVRLVLSATDRAYANPRAASVTRLTAGSEATLALPTVPPPGGVTVAAAVIVLSAIALLVVAGSAVAAARRRAHRDDGTPDDAADAVVVRDLRKAYPDGIVAVGGIDLRVQRGQVFGLLGPNGAGKTTTLRMLLGLITPTGGSAELLGHRITPGHPVLHHVGALVEGPGFAPYLSGRDNLVSYWRAGGRPLAEAHLDDALAVAALGDAIERPVRTYSHGMRQRLGIAQALLGAPHLLVLDEPTDGLDPGQIRGMRDLLAGLAGGGRTVLISSHLLAEVEQVCTHVAVMNAGYVVAAGPTAELAGDTRSLEITTDDRPAAQRVLVDLVGADHVRPQGSGLLIDLDGREPPDLVDALVAAGVRVRSVTPRRRLEDAFLRLVRSDQQ